MRGVRPLDDADKTGAPLRPLTALSTQTPGTSHGRLHFQKHQSPRDKSPVSSGGGVGGRRNEGSSGTGPEDGRLHLHVGHRVVQMVASEALVSAHSTSGNTSWAKAPDPHIREAERGRSGEGARPCVHADSGGLHHSGRDRTTIPVRSVSVSFSLESSVQSQSPS